MEDCQTRKKRPPRSLAELEQKPARRWKFGLGKLIIVTNVMGIVVSIMIVMGVAAWNIALWLGILVGFLSPMLVSIYLAAQFVWDMLSINSDKGKFRTPSKSRHPIDD